MGKMYEGIGDRHLTENGRITFLFLGISLPVVGRELVFSAEADAGRNRD